MALDVYAKLYGKVLLRCPLAGQMLARDWINNAFRRVAERRAWSWLIKRGQFLSVAAYSTGTAAVTHNSATVTGVGTVWTAAMVGRQFRVSSAPTYTVKTFTNATTIVLDDEYGGETDATASYQIFKSYYEVPADFHSFKSLWDPYDRRVLDTNTTQEELNRRDPNRENQNPAYCAAFLDYYTPAGFTVSVPRYELWPAPITQRPYPYLYESRPVDLEDSSATLPRFIHGDLLVEMGLEQAALWPGPSPEKPNPYFSKDLARHHANRVEQLIMEAERQDEEVGVTNISYPYSDASYLGDADWLQSHSI